MDHPLEWLLNLYSAERANKVTHLQDESAEQVLLPPWTLALLSLNLFFIMRSIGDNKSPLD